MNNRRHSCHSGSSTCFGALCREPKTKYISSYTSGRMEVLPACADDGLCRLRDVICGNLYDCCCEKQALCMENDQSKTGVSKLQPRGQIQPILSSIGTRHALYLRLICGCFHAPMTEQDPCSLKYILSGPLQKKFTASNLAL